MPNINDGVSLSYLENEQVLNLLPIPIAVLKGDLFVIHFANDAMFDFWKRDRTVPTIGRPLAIAFPETHASFFKQLIQVLKTGEEYMDEEVLLTLNDGDGKAYTIYIDYSYKAIYAENELITGILITAQDVTHKVAAKQLLQDTKRQLEDANHALNFSNEECLMAIEIAQLGAWMFSADQDKMSFSKRSAEIHGLTEQEISLSSALDMVREDYRVRVERTLTEAINSGKMIEMEYPIKLIDAAEDRWIRSTGRVVMDVKDHTVTLKGTLMDITDQKMESIRKDEFIGIASHELKTPLTSLNGLLQLLRRKLELKTDSGLGEMMELALSQCRKMTRMINSFVNISRLESGRFELELADFDVGELVNEHLNEVRLTAPRHKFNQYGCQALHIRADRVKIGALLSNLIANAIKYTPADRSITISCTQKLDFVEVSVRDEGCGIAEKDKRRIFERFSRIENLHVKNSAGFGIGLFLSAEIIKYHHGKIWVENNKDIGCTFYFQLPISVSI